MWNETFQHTVTFSELALVRFLVMDHDLLSKDDFIGQFTLPLNSIATGIVLASGFVSLFLIKDIVTFTCVIRSGK